MFCLCYIRICTWGMKQVKGCTWKETLVEPEDSGMPCLAVCEVFESACVGSMAPARRKCCRPPRLLWGRFYRLSFLPSVGCLQVALPHASQTWLHRLGPPLSGWKDWCRSLVTKAVLMYMQGNVFWTFRLRSRSSRGEKCLCNHKDRKTTTASTVWQ